ncbi:MAG: DNA helicase RecG, partial [Peptococcaceae bacterium]|nr:DNA helicase RecG [Peptococcaceae bacterium]
MCDNILTNPVQSIKTVGLQREKELHKANIFTLRDLLNHFPRQYQDRTIIRQAGACNSGETATFQGTVVSVEEQRPRRGMTVTKLALHDGLGVFYGVWFNQPFIKRILPLGAQIFVTGKVERGFGIVQVSVEDYELAGEDGNPLSAGRLVPVYPLTGKLNQRLLRGLLNEVLEQLRDGSCEFLPQNLLKKLGLTALPEAWQDIHYPDTLEMAEKAKKRFVFEELFLYQMTLLLNHQELTTRVKDHNY